jgi:hypothetical protein
MTPFDTYTLRNRVAVPVSDDEWKRLPMEDRRVAKTEIGPVTISTVFLGLDHGLGDGPPRLFETMIFGGEHDEYQDRCSTWEEAEAQHEVACALVRGAPPQLTRAASGGDGVDLERRIAELERQLADMRSQRQYWNAKAEDQAALVALLERQLAEAEGKTTGA